MHAPDHELLQRAAQGDEAAFHELVDRHAGHLYAVAYSMLGNAADAEDVVQETLTGAFKGMGGFRGQAAVKTWLLRILVRQAALQRRTRLRMKTAPLEDVESMVAPQSSVAMQSPTMDVDRRADVQAMLQTLSREHREVMILREFEGLSYEEMAEALGVPRGTVESRLHRARQELRERFKEYLS